MAYPPWSPNGLNRETRSLSPSVRKCLTTDCPVIAIDRFNNSVSKYDIVVLFEFEFGEMLDWTVKKCLQREHTLAMQPRANAFWGIVDITLVHPQKRDQQR